MLLSQPLTGDGGFFAEQLQADMEAHGTQGAFTRLQTAFSSAKAEDIEILSALEPNILEPLPHLPNGKDMLAALKEALPTLGRDACKGWRSVSPQTCPRLPPPPNGRTPCAAS